MSGPKHFAHTSACDPNNRPSEVSARTTRILQMKKWMQAEHYQWLIPLILAT
jgi:hypothetical protein